MKVTWRPGKSMSGQGKEETEQKLNRNQLTDLMKGDHDLGVKDQIMNGCITMWGRSRNTWKESPKTRIWPWQIWTKSQLWLFFMFIWWQHAMLCVQRTDIFIKKHKFWYSLHWVSPSFSALLQKSVLFCTCPLTSYHVHQCHLTLSCACLPVSYKCCSNNWLSELTSPCWPHTAPHELNSTQHALCCSAIYSRNASNVY